MSKQHWKKIMLGIGISTLLLGACSADEEKKEDKKTSEESKADENKKSEEQVQQELPTSENDKIVERAQKLEEAEGIPAEDKEELTQTFDQYIKTFNEKDYDAYMNLISKQPINFKYEDEEKYVKQIFDSVDSKRTAENVKIINYNEVKSDVYAEISATTKDPDSGKEVTRSGRQVTVFNKQDDGWKVVAIFFQASDDEE
ncbi:hypothetical protein R3398_18925 [Rossellomorea marisflavi]|nr:hypothetical protein [Rossellomorea marisflavi]MDW4528418.1 hypothetical protein [Rossellomorea marisflavi]